MPSTGSGILRFRIRKLFFAYNLTSFRYYWMFRIAEKIAKLTFFFSVSSFTFLYKTSPHLTSREAATADNDKLKGGKASP